MDFDIIGQLAAIHVPHKKPLQPMFEGVVNAFQSIEDAGLGADGQIEIVIERDGRLAGLDGSGSVCGFTIIDNGIGFTEVNLSAFFTAYSRNKVKRGGKGIGRFTFLKLFDRTEIDSHFTLNGNMVSRHFTLPATITKPTDAPMSSAATSPRTSVELAQMKEPWKAECEQQIEMIAVQLIAHCIPFFANPACPSVTIRDDDGGVINLNDFFKKNFDQEANVRTFVVDGHTFTLKGFRLWHTRPESKHRLLYAANYREVVSETLTNEFPSIGDRHLNGDKGRTFVYLGFIEGDYLDIHSSTERLSFSFPQDGTDGGATLPGIPSLAAIRAKAVDEVKLDLAPFLADIESQTSEAVRKFVAKAPELRPMLRYLREYIHEISPAASGEQIHAVLQKHKFVTELALRREGSQLIKELGKEGLRPEDYDARLNSYLERSNELGKSALARYVAHRKLMLEFLEKSLQKNKETGKYRLEDVVHRIIYPMKTTSTDVAYDQQNLWIIDEKLAYHWYLQSDLPLNESQVFMSGSDDRPDLMIFDRALSFGPDKDVLSSVAIVEFKKPDRHDYSKEDPVEQAYRLIRQIRSGHFKDKDGREIQVSAQNIPAFIYVICDVPKTLQTKLEDRGFKKTIDQLGYYSNNETLNAYVEVIPYAKLLRDSKQRNRVLFERLNLPAS